MADISYSGALDTVQTIQELGGTALAAETDVADPGSVRRLVDKTLEAFSQVHVLLNNAATQINKSIEDTTIEEWNCQMAVNRGGVFLSSKFCLPFLRMTRGNIVIWLP